MEDKRGRKKELLMLMYKRFGHSDMWEDIEWIDLYSGIKDIELTKELLAELRSENAIR